MFLPTGRAGARRARINSFRVLFLLLSLSIPSALSLAQGGIERTGTGGTNKIQGRIYFPSGRRSDATAVKVVLESTSSERLSVMADLNGSFSFQSLAPGSYYLTVEAGDDYETARESVVIEELGVRSRSMTSADLSRINVPRSFNVMINLRPKQGRTSDRASVVNAGLANVPKTAAELYEKAAEAAQAGDAKKAVELLRAAVAHYPDFGLAYNELGLLYLRLRQPEKAVEAFRSAMRIRPDDFSAHLNYGIALLEKRETAEAEAQLRQAAKKNESSWAAHMYLGVALLNLSKDGKTGQFDAVKYTEAQKELEQAVGLGKDEAAVAHRYLGGIYWGNREYGRAADAFETYLRLAPKARDAEKLREFIKELRAKG